jgi:hypothetical protein
LSQRGVTKPKRNKTSGRGKKKSAGARSRKSARGRRRSSSKRTSSRARGSPPPSSQREPGGPPSPPELTARYIYGIADTGEKMTLESRGIEPSTRPYTVPYNDISAIVSDSRYKEYDPSDENVGVHHGVLQQMHDDCGCTVLPFRFSTIAKSEGDVTKILSSGYEKFKQKIDVLRGKVEVAVRLFCNVEGLRSSIVEEEGGAKDESAIQEEMRKRTVELATNLLDELKAISSQHALNDLVYEDMILNAAFLIEQDRYKEFSDKVKSFQSEKGKNLRVQMSQPLVPYSFMEPPPEGPGNPPLLQATT